MGMMFARRRMEAAKEHMANKAKAHEENHKAVHEAAKQAQDDKKAVKVVKDASVKPGAK